MKQIDLPEIFANIIQMITIVFIMAKSVRFLRNLEKSMVPVFFVCWLASTLINQVYWVVYDLLRPGIRMPFAANEFGEVAIFLFLASILTSIFGKRMKHESRVIIPCALFMTACTGLWIGWSGEWVQDVIAGLSMGYLCYTSVQSVRITNAFSKTECCMLTAASFVLVACQALIFALPVTFKKTADNVCYVLMFTILIYILYRCVKAIKDNESAEMQVSLAFINGFWIFTVMFMSSGNWYIAAYIFQSLGYLLMYISIRKEVTAE